MAVTIVVEGVEAGPMLAQIIRLLNLILTGMITGHEFAGLAAVHPALAKLTPVAGIRAEQEIYRRNGQIMPVYMTVTFASFLPVLALERERESPAFRLTLAGALCFAAMLAVTLTRNLPINSRIVALPPEERSETEFRELRQRWDRLHAIRNVLNLCGLVFAGLGALSRSDRR
jgi:uncharacterized membrane protein